MSVVNAGRLGGIVDGEVAFPGGQSKKGEGQNLGELPKSDRTLNAQGRHEQYFCFSASIKKRGGLSWRMWQVFEVLQNVC